jgi:hypothetical protein
MTNSFIKLNRCEKTNDLIECHPNAFLLLTVIALRARRVPNIIKNLDVCECFVGDFDKIGLSRQQYRTALDVLESLKFIIKTPTNKGTVVKLINSNIYDINIEDANQPDNHPDNQPDNQPATTNKKLKKLKNEKKKHIPASDIIDLYNKTLPELPKTKVKSDTLKKNIKARWNEYEEMQNMEAWKNYFLEIRKMPFLMGISNTDFRANLTWLVGVQNMSKVLNGAYEKSNNNNNGHISEPSNLLTTEEIIRKNHHVG